MRSERHRLSTISVRARLLGETNVKAVLLAGGFGTRIAEESGVRPKPMVEIGGRPILWHIMKIYSAHGINDFIVCCGYKGEVIKNFFANYFVHVPDVQFDLRTQTMTTLQFCSPSFDLPIGALSRTPADKFAGYHSSADHLDLVRPESPADSFDAALRSSTCWRRTGVNG